MKTSSLLAMIVLALVALAHVVRLALGGQVTIGGVALPMWASGVGALLSGGAAVLLWRDRAR